MVPSPDEKSDQNSNSNLVSSGTTGQVGDPSLNGWETLDTTAIPNSASVMSLMRHGQELAIWVQDRELMSSRVHGSEDALAELAFARLRGQPGLNVLIGGLGMGFTLAAAVRQAPPDARLVVAELVPAVARWNQGVLAPVAGSPLLDPRVTVYLGDVCDLIRQPPQPWDILLLDVDNGPKGFTRKDNDWLYSWKGLEAIQKSLSPRGVLGIWSVSAEAAFSRRLSQAGFVCEEHRVRSRGSKGGHRHMVWIGTHRAERRR